MRNRIFIFFLSLWSIACYHTHAQNNQPTDKWMEYIQQLAEDMEDHERIEALYSDLSYLSEHPINLNTATAESLRRLVFLSDVQIDAILAYRQKNGAFLTIYELKNISALDRRTIEMMQPFVYADETAPERLALNPRNLLKYGKNEFIVQYNRTLERKQGYRRQPDSILQRYPNRVYLGEPFYHSLRYSYTFDDRIQAGLVAEKDAGEPFRNTHHKGYDYYSAHLLLKDMGWLHTLALGDYKASFGQGLVLSHDFSPMRNEILSLTQRRNNGFRRHYSTNEQDYFCGVAATFRHKNWDMSLFYSRRKQDASTDSTSITSFQLYGMHRTVNERKKMRAATIQAFGGNIRYAGSQFHIGLTALTYDFGNLSVEPPLKTYNRYYFRGKRNANASIDYMIRNENLTFFGETALSQNGAWATLNTLHWTPASFLEGILLYRNYARDYQAYWGNAFSQSSHVQNEEGLYIGLQISPLAYWKLNGYADFFRFPWIKYGVDAPSSGFGYMIRIDYSGLKNTTFYVRYRYRERESNHTIKNLPETYLQPTGLHRLRAQIQYTPSPEWSWRAAADLSLYHPKQKKISRGLMISNAIGWKPMQPHLQADLYVAFFRTDDFQSRIYSYEKNLLYAFGNSSLHGKGMRTAVIIRYRPIDRLTIAAKIGRTHYFEGEHIGSGLETIDGKGRTDFYAMVRWKF